MSTKTNPSKSDLSAAFDILFALGEQGIGMDLRTSRENGETVVEAVVEWNGLMHAGRAPLMMDAVDLLKHSIARKLAGL